MADCGILTGISQACRDNSGGVRRWYIAPVADFTDISFDYDADGIVTGSTAVSAVTYSTNKNTSNFVETYQSSVENGTIGFDQVATLVFSKMEQQKRNEVLLMAQADMVLFAETRNGKFWLLGETEGVTLNGGSSATGTGLADLNGYTVTLQAMEPLPAREVSASAMATIITD